MPPLFTNPKNGGFREPPSIVNGNSLVVWKFTTVPRSPRAPWIDSTKSGFWRESIFSARTKKNLKKGCAVLSSTNRKFVNLLTIAETETRTDGKFAS